MEPTKHQYDHDVATVYGFLSRHGLEKEISVNIECNHATLAGNSFEHEVATAVALGIFGSVDANRGDPQNGWDTDQFPYDVRETALAMHHILKAGGLTTGGFNFDAKLRRQSTDLVDLFHGHIGGVDTLAKGLLVAAELIETEALTKPLGSATPTGMVRWGAASWPGRSTWRGLRTRCSPAISNRVSGRVTRRRSRTRSVAPSDRGRVA